MGNNGRVRVKVCGITSPSDALLAEAAGADALGLIFAAGSKRQLTLDRAHQITTVTGPFVQHVGVFRDQPLDEVLHTASALRLSAVQLHGSESPDYVRAVAERFRTIRAVPFAEDLTAAELRDWPADHILLDALTPGAGRTFDWQAARHLSGYPGLVLAGGLNPDNVAAAIAVLRPAAVDVASGVEESPGRKSRRLLERFVRSSQSRIGVSTGEDVY